ncbi:MAG: hypothetical protein AB2689_24595 [Candidatus Thiodiazotropha taylori]
MKSRTESLIGQASSDDIRIALNYKDAAIILFKSDAYQDGITLPALFLIRQFLELGLKYNIRKLNSVSLCDELVSNLTKEHDLNKLHKAFISHYKSTKAVKNISGLKEQGYLDALKMLTEKISLLDGKSQGFRYSRNTNSHKMIALEETFILANVFKLVEDSGNFLASIDDLFCL